MGLRSGLVAIVGLALGCSGGSGNVQEVDAGTPDAAMPDAQAPDAGMQAVACDPTQSDFQYVVSEITVPASATESKALAQDIDGDDITENALGGLLGALNSTADLNLQTEVEDQIARGDVIMLFALRASSAADSPVAGLCTYEGTAPSPAPCLNPSDVMTCGQHLQGTASFDVAADTPEVTSIEGAIAAGNFLSLPPVSTGRAFVRLPLGGGSALLPIVATQIDVQTASASLMSGKIGGAVSTETVDEVLIPAIATMIGIQVGNDCSPDAIDCNCTPGSSAASMLSFFDDNNDCAVTPEELAMSSLIEATLRNPDLDLLDAAGMPGSDGVLDHLSLGFGFSAVAASF